MILKTSFLALIVSPVLGVVLYTFVFLIVLLNEFARLIVKWILFVKYDDLIELVTDGSDAYWGYKKKDSTRNVIVFMVASEGSFTQEYVTKFYREEIQTYNDGRQRPYEKLERIMITHCGYSCWKKANNFNISNHIRVLDKNQIYCTEEVQNYLTQFGDDLEEDRPQWELIIMPKFDDLPHLMNKLLNTNFMLDGTGEIKSILFIRFLHAYMDGASVTMLCKERITTDAEYIIDPIRFQIDRWKMYVMYISTFIYGPYCIVVLLFERFFNQPWIVRDNGNEPRRKYYTWAKSKRITDPMLRKIRAHCGNASVANIFSTAFAIAARKVLPKERLVDELLLTELIAYFPYPDSRPQNRFTCFTFPILSNEENHYDKLLKVQRDSLKSMLGPDIVMSYVLVKIFGRLPSFVFPFLLHGSISSMLLSNLPYCKRIATLPTGEPLLGVAAFTPHPNDLGLSITTTRYGEDVKIFSVADSTWLSQKELSRLIDQIPLEIIQMAKEAGYEESSTLPPYSI